MSPLHLRKKAVSIALSVLREIFSDVVRRHVINLTLLIASLGGLWAGARAIGWSNWLATIIAAIPPAIFYSWVILPQQRATKRQAQLIQIARREETVPGQSFVGANYFLIGPYPPERRAHYQRADGVHERVLRWVRQTHEPILILTGESGTGKSSLLQAYVIPELEIGPTPFKVLAVRSFDNPVRELRNQLGKLWERPPDDIESSTWSVLLERALGQVKLTNTEARLLLVFDQFEEFIILPRNESEQSLAITLFIQ